MTLLGNWWSLGRELIAWCFSVACLAWRLQSRYTLYLGLCGCTAELNVYAACLLCRLWSCIRAWHWKHSGVRLNCCGAAPTEGLYHCTAWPSGCVDMHGLPVLPGHARAIASCEA